MAGRGAARISQSSRAQSETPATTIATARKPRCRSSSRRQQRSTSPGSARKAGRRSTPTQPARDIGDAKALAATAIHSAGGSSRPAAPRRKGSLQGAPSQKTSPNSETAAVAPAGEETPQNVPHQAPNSARSRDGARPAIGVRYPVNFSLTFPGDLPNDRTYREQRCKDP